MSVPDPVLNLLQSSVDFVADHWPAPEVAPARLRQARLVAHRGPQGPGPKENLCASFEECAAGQVWGVEFDVRWNTADVPVLLHDPKPDRTRAEPLAPLITKLGGRAHLMIELKEPLTPGREAGMAELLARLGPVTDYHFLTLDPEFLAPVRRFPKECFVLVTDVRSAWASDYVLRHGWGGVAGHYWLLHDRLVERHKRAGQRVGVGFVDSPNNLCRQLAREVDWVFSNQAVRLQAWLQARLDGPGARG